MFFNHPRMLNTAWKKISGQPRSLAEYFGIDEVNFQLIAPSSFAHVIIDVQKTFCDPEYGVWGNTHTHDVSTKIAEVMPAFRQTSVNTVIVYYDDCNEGYNKAEGGLHLIEPGPNDIPIGKNDASAFKGSKISGILRTRKINNLIVSGFNADACVAYTVSDALAEEYKVAVLQDCVGKDSLCSSKSVIPDIDNMVEKVAFRTTSEEALTFLNTLRQTSP